MSVLTLGLFGLGLVLLIGGAELLVRGAARLAAAVGMSPLVIGLTVVAYGTSAPELAVGVQSAVVGQAEMALGNVVGSNIFNLLFILGVSALVVPLAVAQQLVRWDVPLLIALSALLLLLGLDGTIGRGDGLLLVALGVAYTVWLVRQSRKETRAVAAEYEHTFGAPEATPSAVMQLVWISVGLALLVLGSRWLVAGAVTIAHALGLSELIIALTIVAAGTSLPEVATSILASVRGERDIAVGNVVGSSIFNLLSVLGLSSVVAPHGIIVPAAALHFDIPVMIAAAIACLPVFFTGHVIARWEGALFLGYYVAYTLYLLLAATRHDAASVFGQAMLLFVLPLTAITLAVLALRAARSSADQS